MNASEVLNSAADLLSETGWIQGGMLLTNSDGSYSRCVAGALAHAGGPDGWGEDVEIAADILTRYLDIGYVGNLVMWNDAPGRTAEEVIHALREAAKL